MRQWVHVQWSAYGHWLPGSPRGFRNHEVRTSATYKSPTRDNPHEGLARYAKAAMRGSAISFSVSRRRRILDAIVEKALDMDLKPVCVCVAARHVHAVVSLERDELNHQIGRLKRHSSHAVKDDLPGRIWAARCHARAIDSREHQVEVFRYIAAHGRKEGAAVWTFREVRR